MTRQIALLLRLEGLVVLGGGVALYAVLQGSWLLFALLLLVPDLSMLGYLKGPRLGATLYNLGHTYLAPAALWFVAVSLRNPTAAQVAVIWAVHIGLDRALGFGLKRPTGFRDTHLDVAAGPASGASARAGVGARASSADGAARGGP